MTLRVAPTATTAPLCSTGFLFTSVLPDLSTTLWLFTAAFAASALGGVLGMASGIFIVPMLTLLFGVDIYVAIGASLISVIACSCGSAAAFLKERLTNVRLAIVLETATTLGGADGSIPDRDGFHRISLWPVHADSAGVGPADAGAAARAVAGRGCPAPSWATALRLHGSFADRVLGREVTYQVGNLPLGLGLMYGAGVISALLGIGSGVLKIPAMDSALRLPIKVSSATSNFMIGVTAAASAGAYFVRGDIDIGIAGPVALGSVVGALLGARLLMGLPAERLRLFFAVVLVLLAVQMGLSAMGISLTGAAS